MSSSIFQDPKKLHLTLGTLFLFTEDEIAKAKEILQQSQAEISRYVLETIGFTTEGCFDRVLLHMDGHA